MESGSIRNISRNWRPRSTCVTSSWQSSPVVSESLVVERGLSCLATNSEDAHASQPYNESVNPACSDVNADNLADATIRRCGPRINSLHHPLTLPDARKQLLNDNQSLQAKQSYTASQIKSTFAIRLQIFFEFSNGFSDKR